MSGSVHVEDQRLDFDYITFGRFSGSAVSLLQAFDRSHEIRHHDLTEIAKHPRLLSARVQAMQEAARVPQRVPWSKTAAWSSGLQREVERRGWMRPDAPTLFVQTMAAFAPTAVMPRYYIYTDRLSLEGARSPGSSGPRASEAWLERERAFVRGASRIFFMGEASLAAAVEKYGLHDHKLHVVGAGPNASPAPVEGDGHCRRLLFVGTQWERKGGPELLAAFGQIASDHPTVRLTIAGVELPGNLPPNVDVIGRIPHAAMTGLYEHADALVIPTHDEPYGIALTEALLSGIPCIGTTVGNQRSIVADAGICVAPGDIAGLVNAIRELITGYDGYKRAAVRRSQEMHSVWDWDRVAHDITSEMLHGDAA